MKTNWVTWCLGGLWVCAVTGGCHEISPAPPGGDPWPTDTQDLGDGGWGGGGGTVSGTTATDTDLDSDTGEVEDTEQLLDKCPALVGDRNLAIDDFFEIPLFTTGEESVFSDLFLSPGDRVYLVNDRQYCEIVLNKGIPNFAPESGSFCTLTPDMSIRGWTLHRGAHFVLDKQSRTVFSGFASGAVRVTYDLPAKLGDPTGLASDGVAFWLTDGANNQLWRIDTEGGGATSQPSLGMTPLSIYRHGSLLYVLHGYEISAQTREGEICYTLGLPVLLSGFSIDGTGQFVYGVEWDNNVLYRFELSPN